MYRPARCRLMDRFSRWSTCVSVKFANMCSWFVYGCLFVLRHLVFAQYVTRRDSVESRNIGNKSALICLRIRNVHMIATVTVILKLHSLYTWDIYINISNIFFQVIHLYEKIKIHNINKTSDGRHIYVCAFMCVYVLSLCLSS